ncbi:50S ribosomal protein L30e [uncultured archaeon]|nr:50S ribosomal protein L30e [uncultured archaeon]
MVDVGKAIRLAVDTGKVRFGSREALQAALNGEAKLIVVAGNIAVGLRSDINYYSALSAVSMIEFCGTSIELGSVCGKPFPVSALTVIDAGSSNILEGANVGVGGQ